MEDRYIETQHTWNSIAQLYEDKFMEFELYNDSYQRFCDLLSNPTASVLEIGCGPGNISRYLLGLQPNIQLLATDSSENMLALAKKNNPTVATQLLDCRNLLSLKHKFDGIICGFTIPYLSKEDQSKLISDSAQMLNEGGLLYVSYVEGNYDDSKFMTGSSGDRLFFYYYDVERIKQSLELNGFTMVEQYLKEYQKAADSIETHTLIIAKKNTK